MKTTINESASDYLMSHLEICKTKEDLILAFWFYWVESVTTNKIDFLKVVACSAVNKWFLIELQKEETELSFNSKVPRYERKTQRLDLLQAYKQINVSISKGITGAGKKSGTRNNKSKRS